MGVLIFIFWIIASLAVGAAGGERKIGFFGAFILSLVVSPLLGGILILASKPKSDAMFQEHMMNEARKQTMLLSEMRDKPA